MIAPWTAHSPIELLKNIKKYPLKFSSSTSPQISSFLTGCLQFEENKRLSWDEIYKHKLLGDQFIVFIDFIG